MSATALNEVQRLIEQLTPLEQVRLLEYLVPRIARAVATALPAAPAAPPANGNSWREFFRIGEALADHDSPQVETLTAAVLAMRR